MNSDPQIGYRLGVWRAYPLRNLLVGPPGEIHIEPKVMQVLEQLAANAGEVVEREHLLETLWGGRAMSDEPLTRCIATLRRVLDDSAKEPTFIQTIPKRGYRLVCDVEALARSSDQTNSGSEVAGRSHRGLATIGAAFLLIVVAYMTWQQFGDESPHMSVDGAIVPDLMANSVAVLPFANLGPDPDNEYLSDGLADELANQLTRVPGVKVAARTSAFAFKGENTDITDIARQLRVAYVLTGSVRQSEDRLRISAQLTEASSGYHVWSESWDRRFTDIFDIQDEIADAVIGALRVELLNEVPASPRTDPDAYALYLKSREAYFGKTEPGVNERLPQLEEALSLITHSLALDPEYAPAWSQLAWIHFQRGQWTKGNPDEIFALAEAAARRALSIDPGIASALSVMGAIQDLWYWDSAAAAEWYSKALAAAPGHPGMLYSVRVLFGRHGATEGWRSITEREYEHDPVNVGRIINRALFHWYEGLYDAAHEDLELARSLNPDAGRIQVLEALFAYLEGDYERAARLADGGVQPVVKLCALHALGREAEVYDVLSEIRNTDPPATMALAQAYACTGDFDRAFEWLHRAYDQRHPMLRTLRESRLLENLRYDPRWEEIVEKAGVGDEHLAQMRSYFVENTPNLVIPGTANE